MTAAIGAQAVYRGQPFQIPLHGGVDTRQAIAIRVEDGAPGQVLRTLSNNQVVFQLQLNTGIGLMVSVPANDIEEMHF